MSRTVAQDFARWRTMTSQARTNVVTSMQLDQTHGLVCSKQEPWSECPWCAAIAVLDRAERKVSVRVVR